MTQGETKTTYWGDIYNTSQPEPTKNKTVAESIFNKWYPFLREG